jgi:hypothetical protein
MPVEITREGAEAEVVFIGADIAFEAVYDVNGLWNVHCIGWENVETSATGWTTKQVGAVLFLMVGCGEEGGVDEELTELMYKIAEPLIKDWPKECRPIP